MDIGEHKGKVTTAAGGLGAGALVFLFATFARVDDVKELQQEVRDMERRVDVLERSNDVLHHMVGRFE